MLAARRLERLAVKVRTQSRLEGARVRYVWSDAEIENIVETRAVRKCAVVLGRLRIAQQVAAGRVHPVLPPREREHESLEEYLVLCVDTELILLLQRILKRRRRIERLAVHGIVNIYRRREAEIHAEFVLRPQVIETDQHLVPDRACIENRKPLVIHLEVIGEVRNVVDGPV